MGIDIVLLAAFVILTSIVPPIVLHRRRTIWLAFDAGSYAFALGIVLIAPRFGLEVSPSLVLIGFIWLKLSGFCVIVATGATSDRFRLTPLVAAILAGSMYLILVPHVLRWPIDGDEPHYVLIAESLLHDHDLDLANQYANLRESVTHRLDLHPQLGDPVGPHGQVYARHEPLLPLLLIPGLAVGGLPGVVVTMALFGALLVWSVMKLLEEEGVPWAAAVAAYPFIAFGPPVLFYATRIWPEVPAALCLSEALRASKTKGYRRLVFWLIALSLLKLRFIPIAVALLIVVLVRARAGWKVATAAIAIIGLPMLAAWMATGMPLSVHSVSELEPQVPLRYVRGTLGLLLDGQAGILFQAPFWLFGFLALFRWKELPAVVKDAALASLPYLFLLVPRAEWHGGWSPPLRYLVVFTPMFAVAGAWMIERTRAIWVALAGIWTIGLAIHGVAFPWRLFHIANGESIVGETLSRTYLADFSRLIPSLIRPNVAVIPWAIALAAAALVVAVPALRRAMARVRPATIVAVLAVLLAGGVYAGLRPGSVVQFEDSCVTKRGGKIYPGIWTVARFRYVGGWTLNDGDSVSFEWAGGPSVIRYSSKSGAVIRMSGFEAVLDPTGNGWAETTIDLPRRSGRWDMTCIQGGFTGDQIFSAGSDELVNGR